MAQEGNDNVNITWDEFEAFAQISDEWDAAVQNSGEKTSKMARHYSRDNLSDTMKVQAHNNVQWNSTYGQPQGRSGKNLSTTANPTTSPTSTGKFVPQQQHHSLQTEHYLQAQAPSSSSPSVVQGATQSYHSTTDTNQANQGANSGPDSLRGDCEESDSDIGSDPGSGSDEEMDSKRPSAHAGSAGTSNNTNGGKISSDLHAKVKNREHAKNTRMRKKTYIDSLRDQVKQLSEDREKVDRQRRIALSRLAEQSSLRRKVIEEFLHYRAIGELSLTKWEKILDSGIELVLPVTPYRSFPPHEVQDAQRHVRGIQAIVQDTASLATLFHTIGVSYDVDPIPTPPPPVPGGSTVSSTICSSGLKVKFYIAGDETMVAGDVLMCRWFMRSENAVQRGARFELSKHGMLKAFFSSLNRLTFLEMTFDVMGFMQQLRRATNTSDFSVVPNSPQLALEPSSDARIVASATPPYLIQQVNKLWSDTFGYDERNVVGQGVDILRGPETTSLWPDYLVSLQNGLAMGLVTKVYNSSKQPVHSRIQIYPLYSYGVSSSMVMVFEIVDASLLAKGAGFIPAAATTAPSSMTSTGQNIAFPSTIPMFDPRSHARSSYKNASLISMATASLQIRMEGEMGGSTTGLASPRTAEGTSVSGKSTNSGSGRTSSGSDSHSNKNSSHSGHSSSRSQSNPALDCGMGMVIDSATLAVIGSWGEDDGAPFSADDIANQCDWDGSDNFIMSQKSSWNGASGMVGRRNRSGEFEQS